MSTSNSQENSQPPIYQQAPLPYEFSALEPIISTEIMTLHYEKHHKTYINNLNDALKKFDVAQKQQDLSAMSALLSAIKFNGGGHLNHSIFWTNLSPQNQEGGRPPEGELADAIKSTFGSLQRCIEVLSAQSIAIQGSGWGWLGFDKALNRLVITTCENQDPLHAKGLIPLLGIDVWEHAYYLQYKNVRADYVKKIFEIVNWKNVTERFAKARS